MVKSNKNKTGQKRDNTSIRWWAVGLHFAVWMILAFIGLILPNLFYDAMRDSILVFVMFGVLLWFGTSATTLLIAYHVPNLSGWAILMPFGFSLIFTALLESMIGFDGRDQERAFIVTMVWVLMSIAAFIWPLIAGAELRPLRAVLSIILIAVLTPLASFVLFLGTFAVTGFFFPTEYDVPKYEIIMLAFSLPLAAVSSGVGLFLIRQVNVTRGVWDHFHVDWRYFWGKFWETNFKIDWRLVFGHFVIWLFLGGIGLQLFLISVNKPFPNIHGISAISLFTVSCGITALLISHHVRKYSLWFLLTPLLTIIGITIFVATARTNGAIYPILALMLISISFVAPLKILQEFHWRRSVVAVVVLTAMFMAGLSLLTSAIGWMLIFLFYRDVEVEGGPFAFGMIFALAVVITLGALLLIQQVYAARNRKRVKLDDSTYFMLDTDGELTQDIPAKYIKGVK